MKTILKFLIMNFTFKDGTTTILILIILELNYGEM